MTVYGFVGPSGTGKSHRALEVAKRINVACILDDGLLIRENQVIAGVSAKREASRIASIRRALYSEQTHANQVRAALDASGAESVMIIGTSSHMVDEIAKRLKLPPISTYIDIEDIASRSDIEAARAVRVTEGKHVIPVPTFALKKEFSGYFLAPLRRLVKRGKKGAAAGTGSGAGAGGAAGGKYRSGGSEDFGERTVVRPTFSYLGAYSISRTALMQLIDCIALKSVDIIRTIETNVNFSEGGLDIELSVCVRYGARIHDVLNETVRLLRYEMDRQTSLHIGEVRLIAKSLEFVNGALAESV